MWEDWGKNTPGRGCTPCKVLRVGRSSRCLRRCGEQGPQGEGGRWGKRAGWKFRRVTLAAWKSAELGRGKYMKAGWWAGREGGVCQGAGVAEEDSSHSDIWPKPTWWDSLLDCVCGSDKVQQVKRAKSLVFSVDSPLYQALIYIQVLYVHYLI